MRPIVMEQRLRSEMNVLVPSGLYPAGVVPVPDVRIKGPAFFPGGSGLYLEGGDTATPRTSTFPIGCVMVVGHNFDSQNGFERSVLRGKEQLTRGNLGSAAQDAE